MIDRVFQRVEFDNHRRDPTLDFAHPIRVGAEFIIVDQEIELFELAVFFEVFEQKVVHYGFLC